MISMKYRAIIFDIDGTAIINAQHALPSKRLVEVIKKAQPHFKLCTATSRPVPDIKNILSVLQLQDPCVISAGTEIIDPKSNKVIWSCDMKPSDVPKVMEIFRPYPYKLIFNDEGADSMGKIASERTLDGPINVMYLINCREQDAAVMMKKLALISSTTASEVRSWEGAGYVEIHVTNKLATKEHAVVELLKMLNVSKEETIGVGDSNNDIHLFKAVGLKVAMGNATDLLKSQADLVCDTVENDGLAKFIEEQTKLVC